MNIPSSILTLLAGIAITLLSLWLGQNNHLLPVAATATASRVDGLFNTMLVISAALFVVVQGLIVIAAFKFRQKPGDESDGPPIEGNIPLEILWTAIPAVLVLGISVYSFQVYTEMGGLDPMAGHDHQMTSAVQVAMAGEMNGPLGMDSSLSSSSDSSSTTPSQPRPQLAAGIGSSDQNPADLTVNVLGIQYAWIFNYPDLGITSGELHVPVGADVDLALKGQDVIHAFWVPQFRIKQDVIPGRQTELRFTATQMGTYPIVCAELCGGYHGAMRSQVIVHSPEEYETWKQEQLVAQGLNPAEAIASGAVTQPSHFLQPYAEAMQLAANPMQLHELQAHASHGQGSHSHGLGPLSSSQSVPR